MRILFLTHAFNSLTQRLFVELAERGHDVSIELDIADSVALEAVELFQPDVVVAPFLKRAIPEAIWRRHVCLVVHPGIEGDRGPSALDWAILDGEAEWGVTVLQANGVMDGGDIWATRTFPLRAAKKSSLYRNEVTEAAVGAVLEAIAAIERGERGERGDRPRPLDYARPGVRGIARPALSQEHRRIDWAADDTETVLRKIHASDGAPGVLDTIAGVPCHLFGARRESGALGDAGLGEPGAARVPGALLATRSGAVLRATKDGAVWLTHLRRKTDDGAALKLPATRVLGDLTRGLPASELPVLPGRDETTYQDLFYEEAEGVGYLHFELYNGAMSTEDCRRLERAVRAASARDTRVLVLMGGSDFWSNGIHLGCIEAAESPADESWDNIVAMDDLCLAILEVGDKLTIAAMQGNAGAGGVFLALAADRVLARDGVVLNPHYKSMGNLYGSEYWTYLLPKRVGAERAEAIVRARLPISAREAKRLGLVDDCLGAVEGVAGFVAEIRRTAAALAASKDLPALVEAKRRARAEDEAKKPLARYRAEELERMKLGFFGFDPSFHVARYHFVHRVPHAWTPLHLARHRQNVWKRQEALANREPTATSGSAAPTERG